MKKVSKEREVLSMAIWLHDYYEQFAKEVGWQTQKGTSVHFKDLPEKNQEVMLKLAEVVINKMDFREKEYQKKTEEFVTRMAMDIFMDLPFWIRRSATKWYKLNNYDVTDAWKKCVLQATRMCEEAEVWLKKGGGKVS